MKRFISSVLVLVMVCVLAATSFAAPLTSFTRTEFLNYTGLWGQGGVGDDVGWFQNIPEYPDANISLSKSTTGVYASADVMEYVPLGNPMPVYDIKADFDMSVVRSFFVNGSTSQFSADYFAGFLGKQRSEIDADFEEVPVTGGVDIVIKYPSNLSVPYNSAVFSDNVLNAVDSTNLFVEISRTEVENAGQKTLTIRIEVESGTTYEKLLTAATNDALGDFTLTCPNVQPATYGTYEISGTVEGEFVIGDTASPITTIQYRAKQNGTDPEDVPFPEPTPRKIIIVQSVPGPGPSGPGGGGTPTVKSPDVKFYISGEEFEASVQKGNGKTTVDIDNVIPPERENMTFDGWYTDDTYTTKISGKQTFTVDTKLYGRYVMTTAPEVFEDGYHKVYIHGYPDGTVQPYGNITREEVVTALYRLLKDEVKSEITTTENSFTDVEEDRWSVTEVSSMANGGYVNGYEDGSFRPANAITRAEFAAIMLRFFSTGDAVGSVNPYMDITGHWGEDAIVAAYNMNLFVGYGDGTFKPDTYITRAEAMTVINRITIRKPHKEGFAEGHIDWPDISENDWFYNDVIEATNSHDYIRIDDLMTEDWTELKN